MREINLIGLKMTIMGAALTVAGAAVLMPSFIFGGLALMVASLFIGDKINIEEKKKNDSN